MKQIESKEVPLQALSARTVYNLMEVKMKHGSKNIQNSLSKRKAKKRKTNSDSLKEEKPLMKKKKLVDNAVEEQMDNTQKKKKRKKVTNNPVEEQMDNTEKKKKKRKKVTNNPMEEQMGNTEKKKKKKKDLKLSTNIDDQPWVNDEDVSHVGENEIKHLLTNKIKKRPSKLKEHLKQGELIESVDDDIKNLDIHALKKEKKIQKNFEINGGIGSKKIKKVKGAVPLPAFDEIRCDIDASKSKVSKITTISESTNSITFKNQKRSSGEKKDDASINGVQKQNAKRNQREKYLIKQGKGIKMPKKKVKFPKKKIHHNYDFMTRFQNSEFSKGSSEMLGGSVFESLISPVTAEDFFRDFWEKKHLLIKGNRENKFEGILSTKDIDHILRANNLSYTKNIDITSYQDGKRETLNPEGRALASVVWDYFNSGCSIRLLNPQTFSIPVWKLLVGLQEYFNSFCGANVYLTPPGTQGFAPHWDDIEAFILQLEGKKRWRVYKWRSSKDTLPRESSGNFGPDDRLGELVLDTVLETGDLLYFPRGFIHQAEALEDTHSLHITISTYQKNSWVDLLEKLLPAALETAAEQHVEFREGLPRDYFCSSGIVFSDIKSAIKNKFSRKVNELVTKMMEQAPLDAAIDQLARGFIHDSLPPFLSKDEKQRTIYGGGETWSTDTNNVVNRTELNPETRIRLLRKGCVRLLVEDNSVHLFHSVENSREFHEEEPKFIEIAPDIAPGVEQLIRAYPNYISIETLPFSALSDKMVLATGLWEKGLIMVEEVLENTDEEVQLGVNSCEDE